MMSMKVRNVIITGAVLLVVLVLLVAGRGWISSWSYRRAAETLHRRMPADLQAKYGGDLQYTLDKFWSCFEEGICSRNDMTDVMDRMKRLSASDEIEDMDVFEFIDFVSRIYTDRLDVYHRESIERMERERGQSGM
jgi:hypothetical protein